MGDALDLAILYEEAHGNRQIRDYCSQMLTRFKSLEERPEYAFLRHNALSGGTALSQDKFLADLLGLEAEGDGWIKKIRLLLWI